ncbi:unnamed protein product [Closterium sp. NIES-65]|nr:unnamed protein product [Closterium sp. NIES-65]
MRPLLLRRNRLWRRHLSKLPPASLRRGQRWAPPTTPRTRSHLRLHRYSPSRSRTRSPTVVVLLGAVRRRIGGVVLLGVAPPHCTGMRIAVAAVAGGEVTVADAQLLAVHHHPHLVRSPPLRIRLFHGFPPFRTRDLWEREAERRGGPSALCVALMKVRLRPLRQLFPFPLRRG